MLFRVIFYNRGLALFSIFLCVNAGFCGDVVNNPEILCNRTTERIIIDGKIDESAWGTATEMKMVKIVSLTEPVSTTIAYCLYDEKYLYFAFICFDKDIWAKYRLRDSQLWLEDVVEIFIKPDPSDNPYYEFQVSPANTVLDAYLATRATTGNMFFRFTEWNCSGFKSAVKIKGTLNKWIDMDELWTVEVAIPFNSLPSLKKFPSKNDRWLFNLARYDYSVYLHDGSEVLTVSPIKKFDFHRYEEWCILKFN